jgi:hypothetical protein
MAGFHSALRRMKSRLHSNISAACARSEKSEFTERAPSRPSLPSAQMAGTLADPFHQYELAAA